MSSIHLGIYPYRIFLKRTRPRFTPSAFDRYYLIKRSVEALNRDMKHDRTYGEHPHWSTNYDQLLKDTDTYTAHAYRKYLHHNHKMSHAEAELSYSHWYKASRKDRRADLEDSLDALRKYGMINYWHSVKSYDILDISLGSNPVIRKIINVFKFNSRNHRSIGISYMIGGIAFIIALLIIMLMSAFHISAVIMFFVALVAVFNGYSDSEQIKMSNEAMRAMIAFVSNGIENVHVISHIKPRSKEGSSSHAKESKPKPKGQTN